MGVSSVVDPYKPGKCKEVGQSKESESKMLSDKRV
jgi:hypothetical protein